MPPIYSCEPYLRFYQDSVDKLRNIFNRLDLVMDGEPAIRFEDPEVLRVLLGATVGNTSNVAGHTTVRDVDYDHDGMLTEEELAAVTTMASRVDNNYSMFVTGYGVGNTIIETFNEFRFFTSIVTLNNSAFSWCSSLREIILPQNIIHIGEGAFLNTAIEKLIIPEGCKTCDSSLVSENINCKLIDFPSTMISIGARPTNKGSLQLTVICRAITPPTFSGSWSYNNSGKPIAIYVPDASVSAYRTATGWSSSSSIIHPLSEYIEL